MQVNKHKNNIRKFGAGWIRPPGITKTYRKILEDAKKQEEEEAAARRQQTLMDLEAAQADAANREAAAQGGHDEEMMEGAERDLDDDVPEAEEAEDSDLSPSEGGTEADESEDSALDGTQADMTFNEDSFIEGSVVEAEVEHMLERDEAEMAGVLQDERDLDDDIPEAGSYEHTDTELDDSSDEEEQSFVSFSNPARPSSVRRNSSTTGRRSSGVTGRRSSGMTGRRSSGLPPTMREAGDRPGSGTFNIESNRSSFGLEGSSSILDNSSFLRSSPAAQRAALRSRFLGARAQRGGRRE
ncbi:uncharacterized protein EI97DRAFT_435376 [Westerdykella ornata]|uniref:Uncharacterized protein n=1 Tax=Westerdykella ornata TaxID=318751 RepID=A0A6A6JCE5_WESOR|nr:uncharacterized protein EI97DRAFT_435376 [Westerdykella ornata]KAF2274290.1 hypothetical protein EI97DRAFT_435376 [Westerdykella ornata]